MIEDREIWACAALLLKQHGKSAWLVAAQRAEELLVAGEIEGNRTFMHILNRIEQLEMSNHKGPTH